MNVDSVLSSQIHTTYRTLSIHMLEGVKKTTRSRRKKGKRKILSIATRHAGPRAGKPVTPQLTVWSKPPEPSRSHWPRHAVLAAVQATGPGVSRAESCSTSAASSVHLTTLRDTAFSTWLNKQIKLLNWKRWINNSHHNTHIHNSTGREVFQLEILFMCTYWDCTIV